MDTEFDEVSTVGTAIGPFYLLDDVGTSSALPIYHPFTGTLTPDICENIWHELDRLGAEPAHPLDDIDQGDFLITVRRKNHEDHQIFFETYRLVVQDRDSLPKLLLSDQKVNLLG